MKSLILVWGDNTTLIGMFETMGDAEGFVATEMKVIKRDCYSEICFVRGSIGESYQDMSEFLYSFDPRDR